MQQAPIFGFSLYTLGMRRPQALRRVQEAFRVHCVTGLLGPRQAGKSTLARLFARAERAAGRRVTYFDLEDDTDLAALQDPALALRPLEGTVVIDEVQRLPGLFPVLRVLVDEKRRKVRYLILGSASRDLIRQGSETLAGRIGYVELTPFSLGETGPAAQRRLWLRGGFPLSYLADSDLSSAAWRKAYVKTFLEGDIPALGIRIPPLSLRRFWMMLAHYHGQVFNASEVGKSLGLSDHTVRHYLDILSGTFMLRQLTPWVESIAKRQVKSPKVYFRDSGIFHALLGAATAEDLMRHPKLGASWEGFALEEVIRLHGAEPEEAYFWGVHNQAELDLLIMKDGKRIGYEVKYSSRPALTRSMLVAWKDLRLDALRVVFPGAKRFRLSAEVEAVGLQALAKAA